MIDTNALLKRACAYHQQLPPHVSDKEGARIISSLIECIHQCERENNELRAALERAAEWLDPHSNVCWEVQAALAARAR